MLSEVQVVAGCLIRGILTSLQPQPLSEPLACPLLTIKEVSFGEAKYFLLGESTRVGAEGIECLSAAGKMVRIMEGLRKLMLMTPLYLLFICGKTFAIQGIEVRA